jgi:Calcineurin-like phosphoesterase
MKKLLLSTVLFAAVLSQSAVADDRMGDDRRHDEKFTVAVFGDWPYNQNLLANAPLLVNSINADPDVSLIIHVGDIHSGSMACTSAGILPPIPTSNPGWNQPIYYQFQQFNAPLVYTPGDNEWTDCQKTKEFKSGDPLKELASVRSLFFARPGKTLGLHEREVSSQAKYFDPAFPADAQYVENVMWADGKVVAARYSPAPRRRIARRRCVRRRDFSTSGGTRRGLRMVRAIGRSRRRIRLSAISRCLSTPVLSAE